MAPYFPLGGTVRHLLTRRGQHGLLDLGMKVFHVIGPQYTAAFDMLPFEIEKYRRLNRPELVTWYESYPADPQAIAASRQRVAVIRAALQA
jgi:hypothetical protein